MNETGWDRLVDGIDVRFGIDKHGKHNEPLADNADLTQLVEFIEFVKAGERYQLQRVTRPAITDRKGIYHRAASSSVTQQTIYDPNQLTSHIQLYHYQGGELVPIDTDSLAS